MVGSPIRNTHEITQYLREHHSYSILDLSEIQP